MKKSTKITFQIFFMISFFSYANTNYCKSKKSLIRDKDTVKINATNLKIEYLKKGENTYLVYFKRGKDAIKTNFSIWNRTIDIKDYQGKKAIFINQLWEANDTIVHKVKSISDINSMQTVFHESWWKGRGLNSFDLSAKSAVIDGEFLNDEVSDKRNKKIWNAYKTSWNEYSLNWHSDLEIFSILPYRDNVVFEIPFYDPGFSPVKDVYYDVNGTEQLIVGGQKIECWILTHQTKTSNEKFWISKETQEVLKLEQEMGDGRFFRYKMKLFNVAD